jgi:hypothetical protein
VDVLVGPTENKPHNHSLEGLMGISLTYKPLFLDKKRLIRGLLVEFIISSSNQTPVKQYYHRNGLPNFFELSDMVRCHILE